MRSSQSEAAALCYEKNDGHFKRWLQTDRAHRSLVSMQIARYKTKAPQSFLLHFTGCVLLDPFHWSSQRIRSTSENTPTLILLGMFPRVSLNLSQRAETELLLKLTALLCSWGDFLIYPWWSLLLYVYSVNNECSHPSIQFCLSSSGSWGPGLTDQLPQGPDDGARRYPVPKVFLLLCIYSKITSV